MQLNPESYCKQGIRMHSRATYCWLIGVAIILSIPSLGSSVERMKLAHTLPAFPGAEGYGMFTTGGRGGEVYEVTSLADSGPGSLRDAVSTPNRVIVFKVSGTIELRSTLFLSQPNITIAGQTSTRGVCLKNYALCVNARNIIIRYLRIRPGDQGGDAQADGIGMGPRGGSDLIFDHCSVSWGIDENFSIYGLPRVTVQWCIISEALMNSKHPKGAHSMGGILNGFDMTIHHNLFASNNDRNPKFDVANWWPGKNTDFRNNVVYNWGARASWGGNGGYTIINVINNYYKSGPNSKSPTAFLTLGGGTQGEWYIQGNYVEGSEDVIRNNWNGVLPAPNSATVDANKLALPYACAPVTTHSAKEAFVEVLRRSGASYPVRDAVDSRVINDVLNGSGKLINSPSDVGGWPLLEDVPALLDTDHDGIPDEWEVSHGLDPKDGNDGKAYATSGYTYLEEYLNSIAEVDPTIEPNTRPTEPYWPSPKDRSDKVDDSPELRWKAGFGTVRERVYFGTKENLSEVDFKAEKEQSCTYIDKQELSSSRYLPGKLTTGETYYWRVDQINGNGVTPGPTWSFTSNTPAGGPRGGRMEAEDMTLDNCVIESSALASGGKLVCVPSGTASMRFAFTGETGSYHMIICYVDQRVGTSDISISINGEVLEKWIANSDDDKFTLRKVLSINLKHGDIIKLSSSRNRNELGRIDYLDFVKPSTTENLNRAF